MDYISLFFRRFDLWDEQKYKSRRLLTYHESCFLRNINDYEYGCFNCLKKNVEALVVAIYSSKSEQGQFKVKLSFVDQIGIIKIIARLHFYE